MYMRCAECAVSTWIEVVDPQAATQQVTCHGCGKSYQVAPAGRLGATSAEQYRAALSFAETHQIDLPSAYSVLLGITSIDRIREQVQRARKTRIGSDATAIEPSAVAREAVSGRADAVEGETDAVPSYDIRFTRAVREGHLTVQQAIERGDREAWTERLVQRHGLPKELAYEVTDNHISLREAIESHAACVVTRKPASARFGRLSFGSAIVVIAALLVGWGLGLRREASTDAGAPPEPAAPEPSSVTTAEVTKSGPAGEPGPSAAPEIEESTSEQLDGPSRVEGPDPLTVLTRYCEAVGAGQRLVPVEIGPSLPPAPDLRVGIFRDVERVDSLFAIQIRRDKHNRRWVAGDGEGPIHSVPHPSNL